MTNQQDTKNDDVVLNSLTDDKIHNFTMTEAVAKYNEYFNTTLTVLSKDQAEDLAAKVCPAYVKRTTTLPGTGLQIWMNDSDGNNIHVVHINYDKLIAV